MEKNYRKLWIEALRSGKYEQGRNALCRDGKFCCLGVACEVLIEHGISLEKGCYMDEFGHAIVAYNHSTGTLPLYIGDYFGNINESHLIHMNDTENKSFSEIADYLEKE